MQIFLAWIWEEALCGSLHLKLDIHTPLLHEYCSVQLQILNGLAYLEQLRGNAAPYKLSKSLHDTLSQHHCSRLQACII